MTCKEHEKQCFGQWNTPEKDFSPLPRCGCALCSPWKVWITRLVSEVLSITLLTPLLAVAVSTVGVFTLCGEGSQQRWRGSCFMCTAKYDQRDVVDNGRRTTYWRSRRWRLCFCHHTPRPWKSARSRRHSSPRRPVRFPWTGMASTGMEKSFTKFKKVKQKGKSTWKGTVCESSDFGCMQWCTWIGSQPSTSLK